MTPADHRNAVFKQMQDLVAQLPTEAERYYQILRLLHTLDREEIPSRTDGRRMSTEESARRYAMRKAKA